MKFLLTILFVSITSIASAQPATSKSKLLWDQDAIDLITANSNIYKIIKDTSPPEVLSDVVCTGSTSPFVCSVSFPAFTPGSHSITITAGNAAGDSLPSAPLAFTFVIIPTPPKNLRSGSD